MNTRALLLAGLLFALSSAAQDSKRELWMWKDANGVTHYSDRPVPGARKVELNHVSAPEEATVPVSPAGPVPAEDEEEAVPVEYRLLEFLQPTEGQTFFGADATVDVQLRMEPQLAEGHRLALYLDGTLVGGAANSTSYTIGNLVRGAHTLTAVVQDERGNDLLRSQPRTFNVRQPSTIPPAAVGPKLRPPPKPAPRPNAPR
jgi:Domain of unknown function (DUF4124)